jgi:hypothetical protein
MSSAPFTGTAVAVWLDPGNKDCLYSVLNRKAKEPLSPSRVT